MKTLVLLLGLLTCAVPYISGVEFATEVPVATVQTNQTSFCQGETITVFWNVSGGMFEDENAFTLLLSDPEGSFENAQILTVFNANSGDGSLTVTLPEEMIGGTNYRLRLDASLPESVGPPSPSPLAIMPPAEVFAGEFPGLCTDGNLFPLNAGEPSGGWYQGPFVSNNHFNPEAAGEGIYNLTYFYYSPYGCISSAETTIEVHPAPVVEAAPLGPFCSNSVAQEPAASPEGGTWSGPGISDSSFFPEIAGSGEHTIAYSFTSDEGCTASTSVEVTVYQTPDVAMVAAAPVCNGQGNINLPPAFPDGGSYWGPFIAESSFDTNAAPPGSYTVNYSYTAPSGCVHTATTELVVNPNPEPLFDLPSSFCDNAELHDLDPNPAGGTFDGPALNGNLFSPSAAGVGYHTLNYSVSNEFGCWGGASSSTLVIDAPEPELVLPAHFCKTDSLVLLDHGVPSGGQYTFEGSIVETLNLNTISEGYHELNYYLSNASGCEEVAVGGFIAKNTPHVPVIEYDGATLRVSDTQGHTLRWYLDEVPLDIASAVFIPEAPGTYSATLSNQICSSPFAEGVHVSVTSVSEMEAEGIRVYPVPFSDELVIEANSAWHPQASFRLYDINARMVRSWKGGEIFRSNGKYILNSGLSLLPGGVYYLILNIPGKTFRTIVSR